MVRRGLLRSAPLSGPWGDRRNAPATNTSDLGMERIAEQGVPAHCLGCATLLAPRRRVRRRQTRAESRRRLDSVAVGHCGACDRRPARRFGTAARPSPSRAPCVPGLVVGARRPNKRSSRLRVMGLEPPRTATYPWCSTRVDLLHGRRSMETATTLWEACGEWGGHAIPRGPRRPLWITRTT